MPAFKVWNSCRSNKRFVVASSLAEVMSNGAAKLGLSSSANCTVVLEEDGTVIDEDEILLECVSKPLIILQQNETWTAAGVDVAQVASMLQIIEPMEQAQAVPSQSASTSEHASPGTSTNSPSTNCAPTAERIAQITREILAAPPPPYSALVLQHIQGQDAVPERIWSTLIGETSAYYLGKWPDLNDQQHYRAIGQLIYKTYSAIGLSGANPWSAFNKSLSQKIRHTRLSMRTKSRALDSADVPAKRQRQSFSAVMPSPSTSVGVAAEEDVSRHVAEIKKEWDKPATCQSKPHLFALLKATRQDRQQMLSSSSVGCLSSVFDKYPLFQEYTYVLKEFALIFGNEKFRRMSANLTRFMWAVETMNGTVIEASKTKDPFRMLAVIQKAEKATKWHQGKGSSKTMPIVKVKTDVLDGDVTNHIRSDAQEGPSIVLFTDPAQTAIEALFVTGDSVHCQVAVKFGLHAAIMTMISLYYIFDLQYPRPYSMILTLLQTVIMDEPAKVETSKGFKTFLKSVTAALTTVPVPDPTSEQQPSLTD